MSLGPSYTITGSPIAVDDDPNTTEPASARKFTAPTIAVGPPQLWIYRDNGTGTFICRLWFFDDTNNVWVVLGSVNLSDTKTMFFYPFEFGATARLFVQIQSAGGNDTTKCAYGFGIGGITL